MRAKVIDHLVWSGEAISSPDGFNVPGVVVILDADIPDPNLAGREVQISPPDAPSFAALVTASAKRAGVGLLFTSLTEQQIPRGSFVEW
jgi:hypothetical protein